MKEKELYAWIRLILIEAGYREWEMTSSPYDTNFIKFYPETDRIWHDSIIKWIKENK